MIYSKEPDDWHDLQHKVCLILRVCGFKADTEVPIETVRGSVDVDVYAVDETSNPAQKCLCECKHWSSAVPKTVVHAFRSVVGDFGANIGFIISRSGFQRGAYQAARNSNINLVDWYQFQTLFLHRWKEGRYAGLRPLYEKLFDFYSYLETPIQNALRRPGGVMEYSLLTLRYAPQADGNPWTRMLHPEAFPPALPCYATESDADGSKREIEFTDYASFFDWQEERLLIGIQEFEEFVERRSA